MKNWKNQLKICTLGALLIIFMLFINTKAYASDYEKCENLKSFGAAKSVKGLSYKTHKVSNGIVCIVKNKKSYAVQIHAMCSYYNKRNIEIDSTFDDNNCLEPKKSCVLFFFKPIGANYKKFKIDFTVWKVSKVIKGVTKCITFKAEMTKKGVNAIFRNTSKKKLFYISATIVYYDKKNKVIGCDDLQVYCKEPKSKCYVKSKFPEDSDFNTIKPKKYKIYVDSAYYIN